MHDADPPAEDLDPRLAYAVAEHRVGSVEDFANETRIFVTVHERLYFDDCHFGPKGCAILADRIADEMLAFVKTAR